MSNLPQSSDTPLSTERIVIRTNDGFYVHTNPDDQGRVIAATKERSEAAVFIKESFDNNIVALKEEQSGLYVRAYAGGNSFLLADASVRQAHELYYEVDAEFGKGFKTLSGWYWSAINGGGSSVDTVVKHALSHESFHLETVQIGANPRPNLPIGPLTSLRVEGRYFANDSGLFDYREVSGFAALELFRQGKIEHLKQLFRTLRGYRANALRVILTLGGPYWERVIGLTSGPHHSDFYDALNPFCRFAASEGFYTRLVLIGGLESFGGFSREREDVYSSQVHNQVVSYIHNVLHHTRDEANVLYNIANEWNQIGMRDSGHRILELGELVKNLAPHRLMNLTETNGPIADDPMWARKPADFVDAHLERWTGVGGYSWVKRSSESPVVDQQKMPFISGEAINFGTPQPGRPDDAEASPGVAFAYGGTSRVKRYLTNFHYHGGLSADIPDAHTQACMEGWRRGLDAIPFNFPGSWCNGHHSCSPWDINIFPREGENEETHTRGPIRIFGLNGSEGYIGVSIAERANRGIPAHRRSVQEVDRITYGEYSSAVYRA